MSQAATSQRPKRKTQIGFVSSRSGDKSIKVVVAYRTPHPLYQKVVNRQTVLHVHDERNETNVGDKVEVMESRPLSRLKRWRVLKVLHRSAGSDARAVNEQDVAAQLPVAAAAPEPEPSGDRP
jgi:small subunit ribosomal protein S17